MLYDCIGCEVRRLLASHICIRDKDHVSPCSMLFATGDLSSVLIILFKRVTRELECYWVMRLDVTTLSIPKPDTLLVIGHMRQKAFVESAAHFLCTALMISWLDYNQPMLSGYCVFYSRAQRHAGVLYPY